MFAKRIILLCSSLFTVVTAQRVSSVAEPTADYYESAYKLHGTALRLALHNIIDGHTVVSYSSLYTHYQQTDTKPNSVVWDMYSDKPGGTPSYTYTHNQKTCGSYSKEGDCYNREHSWPQSWFNSQSTPSSDLFHVYPTDGYVNNRRSNYPFGKVGVASWTSTNGSKVGSSFSPGYTGTVFEPIDAYKGDLARSQFYMSVRYYTEDGGWSTSPGTNKSDLLTWYSAQLLQWHVMDTVSAKEIARNTAVYGIQKNRNPFIDHPEFAVEIWNTGAAPLVASVLPSGSSTVVVDFTRYLDSAAAVSPLNFFLSNGAGNPAAIQWGVNNDVSKLQLTTAALQPGMQYALQIKNLKSINGVAMAETTVQFTAPGTASAGKRVMPEGYSLEQNYPNPFNPETVIAFSLPSSASTTVSVYSTTGMLLATPVNGFLSAGTYSIRFDASPYATGVYFYVLRSGPFVAVRKMQVIK